MRPDDGEGVLALRKRPGCERGTHRAEGFRGGAEGLVADDQLARKAAFVDAEVQNRIIVAFRQRQKQTVAPHQAQRDRRFSKRQPFAPLKSADGLDLSLAQIAGREDLLLNRILRRLDGDDVLRLFLIIWFDRHGLEALNYSTVDPPRPTRPAKDVTPQLFSEPFQVLGAGLAAAQNRPLIRPRPIDSGGSKAAA